MAALSAIADSLDQRKLHFVDVDGIRTRYYEDGAGVIKGGGHYIFRKQPEAFHRMVRSFCLD